MIRIIDPQKLRAARGERTQREIVEAAEEKFSEQQLSGWENGKYRPRPEVLPYLLNALGVDFEAVSTPYRMAA